MTRQEYAQYILQLMPEMGLPFAPNHRPIFPEAVAEWGGIPSRWEGKPQAPGPQSGNALGPARLDTVRGQMPGTALSPANLIGRASQDRRMAMLRLHPGAKAATTGYPTQPGPPMVNNPDYYYFDPMAWLYGQFGGGG